MVFKKFEIYHLRLKFKQPFKSNFAVMKYKDTVFVKAYTSNNNLVGLGEAPALQFPFYDYEYTNCSIEVLKEFLLPALLKKTVNSVADLIEILSFVKGHHIAKNAVEMAFWHLTSQTQGKPMWELWGGDKKRVPVAISLGFEKDTKKLLKKVEKSLLTGYRLIKINVKPGIDIEILKEVRKRFGDIALIIDANSAYTLDDVKTLKHLDYYTNLILEQPLDPDDLFGHAKLQTLLETPIMLDESITSLEKAKQAVTLGACNIINIIPARIGGYEKAKQIAEFCQRHHIPVRCGGILETSWGKLFNLQLATLPNFSIAGDISGTDRYFKTDIVSPPLVVRQDGFIDVPQSGYGWHINEKTFKNLTINKIDIS